ncbi:MAG: M50 family metallopeptidase [Actinomycetota bacterium]|jgi:regulator of sigma E protease|nr:site-2 protease family protein [Rubrobacter sp.]MDQ3508887.1 M50 family metallopeptidase [Actinomycetota bacterium]
MTVIVAILGLIVLIAIHEFGHMLTAKAFGVRVPEFGIGFGPALFKKKIGSTVYSFRIILLGGFAKIAGMGGDDGSATGMERTRSRDDDEGDEDDNELDDSERRIDGRRLDEAPAPDTYYAKPHWQRALIIFAGPAVNIVFAVLLFSSLFAIQGVPTQLEPEVQAIVEGSTAEEIGIEEGDRLIAMDGENIATWEGFTDEIGSREAGSEVAVTVERGGEEEVLTGELGTMMPDSDAPGADDPQLGVAPVVGEVSHSPILALWEGTQRTFEFAYLQISGLAMIITGQMNFFDNVTGPVGITAVGGEVMSQGVVASISLLAIISLILGVMNLLPILPLDGGHLLFIALEKIARRPISEETMGKVALLGLGLVLMLFVFATYADLSRIFGGEPLIPQ